MEANGHYLELYKTELKDVAKYVITFSKVFGSFPSYVNIFNREKLGFKSWICAILQISLSIFRVGLCLFDTITYMAGYDSMFGMLTNFFYQVFNLLANLGIILVLVGCHLKRHRYFEITDRINKIHTDLCSICGPFTFDKVKKLINTTLSLLVAVFIINMIGEIYSKYENFSCYNLVRIVNGYSQFMIRCLSVMQYLTLLYIIKYEFEIINQTLSKLTEQNSKIAEVMIPSEMQYIVETLRKKHLELNILMEEVNEIFSPIALISLLAAFSALTVNFFIFYRLLESKDQNNFFIGLNLVKILTKWLEIYSILWLNDMTQKERDTTAKILYQISTVKSGLKSAVNYK